MKKFTKLLIFMPIFLSFSLLASCKDEPNNSKPSDQETENGNGNEGGNDNHDGNEDTFDPIGLKDFINGLNKNKNYTYTYEYYSREDSKSDHEMIFKYEDRYTDYGMFSKLIKDDPESVSNGWIVNEKDGTFPFIIDESGNIKAGKALRDIDRKKIDSYFGQVIALDDMKYTNNDDYSRYQSRYNFKFNNLDDKVAFLEASQIKNRVIANTKVSAYMDLANKNNVKVKIQIGVDDYVVGNITKVGTTSIPEIQEYVKAGNGALVDDKVNAQYQQVIDSFESYNYETPLFGNVIIGGYRPQVGVTKIYKKTSSDGSKTAIVKFDDYQENTETTLDGGLIEIQTADESKVYEFTVSLEGKFILGDPFKTGDQTYSHIDDFYALPTSLAMFNEDAKIIEHIEDLDAFGTKDTYIVYEVCKYLGFEASIEDLPPYSVAVFPVYTDEAKTTVDNVVLSYFWDDQRGNYGQSDLLFTNFGNVNLPFIDEYLEVK